MAAISPTEFPYLHGAKKSEQHKEFSYYVPDVRHMIKQARDAEGRCLDSTGYRMRYQVNGAYVWATKHLPSMFTDRVYIVQTRLMSKLEHYMIYEKKVDDEADARPPRGTEPPAGRDSRAHTETGAAPPRTEKQRTPFIFAQHSIEN